MTTPNYSQHSSESESNESEWNENSNSDLSSNEKSTNGSSSSSSDSENWQYNDRNSSDSEEDVRRSKSKKVSSKRIPKRRALKIVSDSEESEEHEYVRRKTASNVQYNESSEEEIEVENYSQVEVVPENESETIDKILRKRQGKVGAIGTITSIYALQDFDDPNEGVVNEDNLEFQYLIKWKNRSHIHNTWETEYSLVEQNVKGLKKLENFIKKDAEAQIWRMYSTPEDIEQVDCDLEMQQNLQESYFNVERIFAESCNSNGDPIYYIKWENLPYSDATWEEAPYIEKNYKNKIEHFHNRQNSQKTPSKHCQVLKYKPVFREIQEQPAYMKGVDMNLVLRDYQMQGLNWLVHSWTKNNSVILADEMGLGKTIQAISFLYYLFQTYELHGPFLCVVPLSTMTAWEREFHQWAPELNFVTYMGDTLSRDIIRQFEWFKKDTNKLKVNAILTSYEMILKDKAFLGSLNWAAVLIDEAHRLKNVESALYKALNEFNAKHKLLITGTPLQNNLRELWALLHFIMPNMFPTWENFEEEHANSAQKGYKKLHTQLEPFLLRRVKKDVEKSLPAKVEQILRVEMTARQKQYYKWILTKNFDALRKGVKGCTTTFTNIVIELKKCCNHCILTKPIEYNESSNSIDDRLRDLLHGSGKLVLLDKLLIRLKETGHRVLIFSQMVRMLNILAEYLRLRRFSFQRLDGGIKGDLRKQAMDHFNAEGSQDFCFLLSTRAGGLGINLATADTVIIFDSDWNPQNDLQAQARAHRIGQKNQVNIYRLVTAKSVEEDIIERAKQKMVLDHLVIQRMDTTGKTILNKKGSASTGFNKEELTAILKFGAEELFKSDENKDEEPNCDIDEILRRAETRDDGPTIAGEELLSAFKVANFATFNADTEANDDIEWDDIIPIQIRRQLELEEKPKGRKSMSPLRPRNALQQKGMLSNKRKSLEISSDDEVNDYNESDGERPKKRGRPSKSKKEKVRNFDDAEIRRFIKSYKKFSNPSRRLDAIARDAQLQDKPLDDIHRLGKMLDERCSKYLALRENNPALSNSFKLGGVSTNAKTIIDCKEELSPLDTVLPSDSSKRKKWLLNVTTKPNNFDVKWDEVEDSKLLIGIYEYGLGSWESIKLDQSLELSDKILLEDNKSPQAAHLLRRSEYLLKILKKHCDGALKQQKGKKSSKNKSKSNEPMHITANSDPVSINALGDLDPSIFNECKEKMRPTKKALRALGSVNQSLPEKEQLDMMRLDLLQIGEQIKICLNDYRDPTEIEMWKKNLWSFVAKFSDFDSKKLQKLYKKLRKQLSKCEKRNKKLVLPASE